jgi:hypothetical protein
VWAGKRGFLKTLRRLMGLEYVLSKTREYGGEKVGVDIAPAEAL